MSASGHKICSILTRSPLKFVFSNTQTLCCSLFSVVFAAVVVEVVVVIARGLLCAGYINNSHTPHMLSAARAQKRELHSIILPFICALLDHNWTSAQPTKTNHSPGLGTIGGLC